MCTAITDGDNTGRDPEFAMLLRIADDEVSCNCTSVRAVTIKSCIIEKRKNKDAETSTRALRSSLISIISVRYFCLLLYVQYNFIGFYDATY